MSLQPHSIGPQPTEHGFTLIELLVVIAIVILLAGILLVSGRQQQGEREVTNAAYELASFIREAQTYGGAVQESGRTSNVYPAYGVMLDPASGQATLFADENSAKSMDASDQVINRYRLKGGIRVKEFCAEGGSGSACGPGGNVMTLLLLFGPNAREPQILHCNGGGQCNGDHTSVDIKLETNGGIFTRSVVVRGTGAVTIP